jgi:hypothetical protein
MHCICYLNKIYCTIFIWYISYSECSETRYFITIAFKLHFRICYQEGTLSQGRTATDGTHQLLGSADVLLGEDIGIVKKNVDASKQLVWK